MTPRPPALFVSAAVLALGALAVGQASAHARGQSPHCQYVRSASMASIVDGDRDAGAVLGLQRADPDEYRTAQRAALALMLDGARLALANPDCYVGSERDELKTTEAHWARQAAKFAG